MYLRMIRLPPPLLVSLRGFPINGVWLTRGGDRERGLKVGLDALLFLAVKARATEEGDYISEQRSISDCESAAHISKTGWEKRRARRDGCSHA